MAVSTRRKLSDEQVRGIRTNVHRMGLKLQAQSYGVSISTIWNVRHKFLYSEVV